MRVGKGERVEWKEGKALCFDDSYVHEAGHEGTEDRYVLIVTLLHPDLGTCKFFVFTFFQTSSKTIFSFF